jgi:hypothetical protein
MTLNIGIFEKNSIFKFLNEKNYWNEFFSTFDNIYEMSFVEICLIWETKYFSRNPNFPCLNEPKKLILIIFIKNGSHYAVFIYFWILNEKNYWNEFFSTFDNIDEMSFV